MKQRSWIPSSAAALRHFLVSALVLSVFFSAVPASGEAPQYLENQWNYVDMSMDISRGIPEDVIGRLARIRENGVLTVATSPYYAPQEFIDPSREGQECYVGADMELARLIALRMGVRLEIVPMEFTEVISSVAEGGYDLAISALSYTYGRSAILELSKGYYYTDEQTASGLLIRGEDSDTILSLDDLARRDIVAQSGSLQETLAAENITLYHKFRRLPSAEDVYTAVMTGEADAGIVDIGIARTYLESNPDCGLIIVPDIIFPMQSQYAGDRVAAPKGEIQLICFVNGVIDEVLASGQYKKWFEEYARYNASET